MENTYLHKIVLVITFGWFIHCSTCEKVTLTPLNDPYTLSNTWNYSPFLYEKSSSVCKDAKEYYFIKSQGKLSVVALKTLKKQNQANIESSCKNNALFTGKQLLFKKMIRDAASEVHSSKLKKDYETKTIEELTNKNKTTDQAGTYSCKSLPSDLGSESFLECECLLYAYYPNGRAGLIKAVQN